MEELIKQLEKLGFEKNTKVVCGFRPHFKKGNDYLFLISADYWPSKICKINRYFPNYNGMVYGLLTENSPHAAKFDWVATKKLILLKLNPLMKAQWKKDGSDIEFIETVI